jgi:dGTPase
MQQQGCGQPAAEFADSKDSSRGEEGGMASNGRRSPYAADPGASRGRLRPEPSSATRSDFRRDCDRIIHSTAFRRLNYKTQVFVYHEGDHYRTRLTHTLEVTQIARSLARALALDEDLAEASALGHDLGHPPFGHAGERALARCLKDWGGFDHNGQTLAVVTRLERRYAAFDGLNLTWETLEGLVKHNGPLIDRAGRPTACYAGHGIPGEIAEYNKRQDLELWSFASPEAQAAAIADDIAYDAHDIDDGLRAGLFALDDLAGLPLAGDILREVDRENASLDAGRRAHEFLRRLITRMIEDVIAEAQRRLRALAPKCAEEIRSAAGSIASFSGPVAQADQAIKAFLSPHMYRHARVMGIMTLAEGRLRELFARYLERPQELPAEWRPAAADDLAAQARQIADFIAGMTDRFALIEHARLFDSTPELR